MIGRIAITLLLAAEALSFYVLGEVIMRIFPEAQNELVSAPAFVIVAFIAFLSPAALDWFGVEGGRRATVVGVVGVVVLYGALRLSYANDLALWDFGWLADFVLETGTVKGAIPPILVSGFFLLFTWARAAWRARGGVWLEAAPRSLVIPFALVTVALVLTAGSEQAAVVTRGGVVFYGVALGALACSQLAQSGSTIGGVRSGGVATAMLAGTAAFAVLGVLVVGVLLEPLVDVLTTPFTVAVRSIAWFITWVIFFPIAWVLTHFFEFIFGLLGGGDGETPPIQLPEAPPAAEEGGPGGEDEGESLASRVTRYSLAGGAIFLGLAIVVGVIFLIAMLQRRSERDEAGEVESERVGNLGEDLRDVARNLFRRERRREPFGEGVLRLYLEVLEAARRAGTPRADSQTPQEFAPLLASALDREVTDEITDAFVDARYAGRVPDEATLTELRSRWEQKD